MTYEEFKRECENSGLPNVTEEEYKAHAPDSAAGKNWTLMIAMRRVRNARRGVGVAAATTTIVGYPLGGREFAPVDDKPAWKQFIPILVPKQGIVELDYEGEFPGTHGLRTEFHYEESRKPKKDGSGEWLNRTIRECVMGTDKLTLETLRANATDIDALNEAEHLKKCVILVGRMSDNWYAERTFNEEGKPDGDWPLEYNGWPVMQFGLEAGKVNTVKCRFMPRSLSKPLIAFPGFVDIAHGVATVGEMAQSYAGADVIVAGYVSRFEASRKGEGNFVQIMVTGLWEIPPPPAQVKLDEPKPAPKRAPAKKVEPAKNIVDEAVAAAKVTQEQAAQEQTVAQPPATAAVATTAPATPATPAPAGENRPADINERTRLIKDAIKKTADAVGGLDKVTVENLKQIAGSTLTWKPEDRTLQVLINSARGMYRA
jgi:hypothetical protein